MPKLRDPTQSQWISDKYLTDLKAALTEFKTSAADIVKSTDDPDKIRQQMDELKSITMKERLSVIAEKYVTMSAKQGVKWANLKLKQRHGKKT